MKSKKFIMVIVVCGVLFAPPCVLEGFREFSDAAREVQINNVFQHLSIDIEIFREQEGRYPTSLLELQSHNYMDEKGGNFTENLINLSRNRWHDTYEYIPSTNGFTIIVIGPKWPSSWFGKQRTIEKHYAVGEALK